MDYFTLRSTTRLNRSHKKWGQSHLGKKKNFLS